MFFFLPVFSPSLSLFGCKFQWFTVLLFLFPVLPIALASSDSSRFLFCFTLSGFTFSRPIASGVKCHYPGQQRKKNEGEVSQGLQPDFKELCRSETGGCTRVGSSCPSTKCGLYPGRFREGREPRPRFTVMACLFYFPESFIKKRKRAKNRKQFNCSDAVQVGNLRSSRALDDDWVSRCRRVGLRTAIPRVRLAILMAPHCAAQTNLR